MPNLSRPTGERNLNKRSKAILEFIREYYEQNGIGPTSREIADGCSLSSTSVVAYHMDILEKSGHVERIPNISRGIRPSKLTRSNRHQHLINAALAVCLTDLEDITQEQINEIARSLQALGELRADQITIT